MTIVCNDTVPAQRMSPSTIPSGMCGLRPKSARLLPPPDSQNDPSRKRDVSSLDMIGLPLLAK
jgi:hypothetical protein